MKTFSTRLALLALIGTLISAYLLYHHVEIHSGFVREPSFCSISPDYDCDKLAKSPYSSLFGVPIASYGLVFYFGLLLIVLLSRKAGDSGYEGSKAASLRFFLASLTIPVTLVLAGISKLLVGTFCLMCMMLYAVNIMLFWVSWKDPERTERGVRGFQLGANELVKILSPAEPSVIRKPFYFAFLLSFACLTLLLPVVIHDGYLKPRAEAAFSRANMMLAVKAWQGNPVLPVPDFQDSGGFIPDVVLGPKDAKVTVLEFSDFECPACRNYSLYLKPALQKYQDRVRFVFKHYPIDNACNRTITNPRHQFACEAARMSVCAAAQGNEAFWKFTESVFKTSWEGREGLEHIARNSGLQQDKFLQCLADPASLQRVKDDIELAIKVGVMSTPTVIVNGRALHIHPKFLEGVLGLIVETAGK